MFFFVENLFHFFKKGVAVLELSVNRRKSDVRDLVYLFEPVHNKLAYFLAGNFRFQRVVKLFLNVLHQSVDFFGGYGALSQDFMIPFLSFTGSNCCLFPLFFTTSKGIVSTVSYVVNLLPHLAHSRRRRIAFVSSTGLESITLSTSQPQ